MSEPESKPATLRRALTLPWLVFYGVGVTVGAGIFALIGEILTLAGPYAPLSFLLAGLIAGVTGVSYALLVSRFPKAGGEAVFVHRGLGTFPGKLVGYGVCATGTISSAVVALAFAGYMQALVPLPQSVLLLAVVGGLAAIAWLGVRESVLFAGVITFLEVGTLIIVIIFGAPLIADVPEWAPSFVPPLDGVLLAGILSGGVIAFFAFVGFEDIENMAEETVNPERTSPRAVFWTLGITVMLYVLLSIVAVMAPDRDAVAGSAAPMAVLFEQITGFSGKPVAAAAAIAMINGILVQIIMVSRVLYGMANDGIAPKWFAWVDPRRRTPGRATLVVTIAVLALAVSFPLVKLAEATSLVTLAVFALVNLSLFRLGSRHDDRTLHRFRWWGLVGALICAGIAGFQIVTGALGGH